MPFSVITAAGGIKSDVGSETTITTTGNIDNLDVGGARFVRMNNATLATIRGLVAGYPGQLVTFVSIGAGNVFFNHQDTNSTAANRLINFVTSAGTPLAAAVGTATFVYDGTTLRWRLVEHTQGAPITPTFAAGDYTANGTMTWTVESGDVIAFTYYLNGRNLTLAYAIEGTTIAAPLSTQLRMAIPNGYTIAAGTTQDQSWTFDNVTGKTGLTLAVFGEAYIRHYRDITLAANWEAVTNNGFIRGNITFGIS
jgi:hypothetical protein